MNIVQPGSTPWTSGARSARPYLLACRAFGAPRPWRPVDPAEEAAQRPQGCPWHRGGQLVFGMLRHRRLGQGRSGGRPALRAKGMVAEEEGEGSSVDEKDSFQEQLEQSRAAVTDEPSQVQTPAAVWLPYSAARPEPAQVGALAALLSWLLAPLSWAYALPARLANWALFHAQRLMTGTLPAKLAGYFAIGAPLVLACAALYSWASGKPFVEGLVQAYGNLYKVPGTKVLGDVNLRTTLLNNVVFFLGTFTFALILGVITEDISTRYQRIREGNFAVQARGHTLILNWNPQLVPLLRQMRAAQEERGAFMGPVVVLAERDKQAMDGDLSSALGPKSGLDITTRKGPPTSTLYLDRAAAALARTVVVLAPQQGVEGGLGPGPGQDCCVEKQVASLLALQALRESAQHPSRPLPHQTVILQSPPAPPASAPSSLPVPPGGTSPTGSMDGGGEGGGGGGGGGGGRVAHPLINAARGLMEARAQAVEFADLDLGSTLANVMAQSAVQPGVASVYCSLVQQTMGGSELYVRRFPELSGLTYGEARRRFGNAVAIGYLNLEVSSGMQGLNKDKGAHAQGADQALHGEHWPHVRLNPSDDDRLLDNSALMLVAKTGNITPRGWEPEHRACPPWAEDDVFKGCLEAGAAKMGPSSWRIQREVQLASQLQQDTDARLALPKHSHPPPKPRHVFVLEWNADGEEPPSHAVTKVVDALKAWLPSESLVTVVGPSEPRVDCSVDSESSSTDWGQSHFAGSAYGSMPHHMHDFEEGIVDRSIMRSTDSEDSARSRQARARAEARKAVHLQYIAAGSAGGGDLRRVVAGAGLAEADAVIVLSSSSADDHGIEADAHIVSALVLLEDVVGRGRREKRAPMHVLGAVHRPETVQVCNHLVGRLGRGMLTAELLQPDEVAAGVLTQIGAEPLLRHVLSSFMTSHRGPTIRIQAPARYALPESYPLTFASVAELVRSKGETALGYISAAGKLILGPPAGEERVYGRGDRVVVLG